MDFISAASQEERPYTVGVMVLQRLVRRRVYVCVFRRLARKAQVDDLALRIRFWSAQLPHVGVGGLVDVFTSVLCFV